MDWDQSYDQVEVKSEVESNLREGQRVKFPHSPILL